MDLCAWLFNICMYLCVCVCLCVCEREINIRLFLFYTYLFIYCYFVLNISTDTPSAADAGLVTQMLRDVISFHRLDFLLNLKAKKSILGHKG